MADLRQQSQYRKEMIAKVKDLFINHKQATVLEGEYTDEIYEFLVSEKLLVINYAEKQEIYQQAYRQYIDSLISCASTAEYGMSYDAVRDLKYLKDHYPNRKHRLYIKSICQKIVMKKFFDEVKSINL